MPADIQITGLCKSYRDKKVLDNLSLTIKAGSIPALMAPSGAGKTTLLRILMGLETPDSGTILGLTNQRISAVFQEDRLCDNLSPVSTSDLLPEPTFPAAPSPTPWKPPASSPAPPSPSANSPEASAAASPSFAPF
ncbi:MAG: ATP-binding cassette domain-containing protein [Eisenbergiella massiliensis]